MNDYPKIDPGFSIYVGRHNEIRVAQDDAQRNWEIENQIISNAQADELADWFALEL